MANRRVPREGPSGARRPADDEDDYDEPDDVTEPEDEAPPRRTGGRGSGGGRRPPRAQVPDDDDVPDDDGDVDEADDGEDDVVGSGWAAWKKQKAEMPSDFPERFQVQESKTLFRFLEDAPFAVFGQHWAEWLPPKSKLSYTCIRKSKDGCPLCDIGDNPQMKTYFNILDLTDPEKPQVKILELGVRNAESVSVMADETINVRGSDGNVKKVAYPLNHLRRYFTIQKTGTKQRSSIVINSIKSRDVEEDWGMAPLTKEELQEYASECYTKDAIPRTKRATLQQIADQAD